MPEQITDENEYETIEIGAATLVTSILKTLGIVEAIDRALEYQPEIEATYGTLAEVLILNRMSFHPVPLYHLADWAQQHGIDRLLGIQAEWLDDDRIGALLEGLAKHQADIWKTVIGHAVSAFKVNLDWLHSDTTSVYFEGAYEDEDGQPKKAEGAPLLLQGYNKDGKRQKVQFVLSLITSGRVPMWYRPWDGNHSDDGIYVADLHALHKILPLPADMVLIGDRKLCNRQSLLEFCRNREYFLAPHPWSETVKSGWRNTWQELQDGKCTWTPVEYVSRNEATRPVEKRTQYRVCEVEQILPDEEKGTAYALRWIFVWSSTKARLDADHRQKALAKAKQGLQRVASLLGKYDYTTRKVIEQRLDKALQGTKDYLHYELLGTDEDRAWKLTWGRNAEAIAQAERFDGIALLCTNVPAERLSAGEAMCKHRQQIHVEQTIDFIKSPVEIRPMWFHSPQRLVGLTLVIMLAVLVAALLEHQIRHHIAESGQSLDGLMPEHRDNPYPTATKMLQAFQDYALVIVHHVHGPDVVHYPKFRSVQQQIWDIMNSVSLPFTPSG